MKKCIVEKTIVNSYDHRINSIIYPNPGLKHQKFKVFPPVSVEAVVDHELPFIFINSISTYSYYATQHTYVRFNCKQRRSGKNVKGMLFTL